MAESPEAASRGIKFLWRGRPISNPPHWRVMLQPRQLARAISSYAARLGEPVVFALYRRLAIIAESIHATQADIRRDITDLREHTDAVLRSHREGLQNTIDAVRVQVADIQQAVAAHTAEAAAQTQRLEAIALSAQQQADHTAAHTIRLDTLVSQQAAGLELTRDVQVRTNAISVPVGDRLLVSRVHGYVMTMPAEDVMLTSMLTMYGSVDAGLVAYFARVLQPGMTFVDVGAHIGIHTLAAATRVGETGRVYSFEPAPRVFDILTTNLALNGLNSRVTAHRQAVSDHAGVARMVVRVSSGLSSLYGTPQESDSTAEVPVTTLDEALATAGSVDYVKLDAEGAEPAIVRGMTNLLRGNPQMRVVLEFAPPLLRHAGVEPARFARELMDGFILRRIDDVTGEPQQISPELLTGIESSNVLLERL